MVCQVLTGPRHCWVQMVQIWAVKSRFSIPSFNHSSRPPQPQKSLRRTQILKHCSNPKQTYTHYCRDAVRHTHWTHAVVQTVILTLGNLYTNVKVRTQFLCSVVRCWSVFVCLCGFSLNDSVSFSSCAPRTLCSSQDSPAAWTTMKRVKMMKMMREAALSLHTQKALGPHQRPAINPPRWDPREVSKTVRGIIRFIWTYSWSILYVTLNLKCFLSFIYLFSGVCSSKFPERWGLLHRGG